MVLVVHQQNSVSELAKKDVIDIYMGRYKTFPNGEPAEPIDFPLNSIERATFYLQLVGKSEQKINAYWSRLLFSGRASPPQKTSSKLEVIQKLNRDSIAYMHVRDVTKEMKIVYHL
jgi:hypothetical protein